MHKKQSVAHYEKMEKLILSIDNNDLIKMIDIKIKNEIPADYLYDLLDNLLIDLEK